MSRYYEIDCFGKFYLPRIDDIEEYPHRGSSEESRIVYSKSDESVYLADTLNWNLITGQFDIFPQDAKILFGSFPLPNYWNIDVSQGDKITVLGTNSLSSVGTSGGSWSISGLQAAGSHFHTSSQANSCIPKGTSDSQTISNLCTHTHTTLTHSNHFHIFTEGWRPPYRGYCVGQYQGIYIPPTFIWGDYTDNTYWTPVNGNWLGSNWDYNGFDWFELNVLGAWATGFRPTKIRVTYVIPWTLGGATPVLKLYNSGLTEIASGTMNWGGLGDFSTYTTTIDLSLTSDIDKLRMGNSGGTQITVSKIEFYYET